MGRPERSPAYRRGSGAPAVRVSCARMLRISWPLAFVAAAAIAVVARKPRLLVYVVVVFAVWFAIETLRNRRR